MAVHGTEVLPAWVLCTGNATADAATAAVAAAVVALPVAAALPVQRVVVVRASQVAAACSEALFALSLRTSLNMLLSAGLHLL